MRPAVVRVVTLVVGWAVGVAVLGSLTFVVVDLAGQVVAGPTAAGPEPDGAASAGTASGDRAGGSDRSDGAGGSGDRPGPTGAGGTRGSTDPGTPSGSPDAEDGGTGTGRTPRDGGDRVRPGTPSGPRGRGEDRTGPAPSPTRTSGPDRPATPMTHPTPSKRPTAPTSPTSPEIRRTASFTTSGGTAVLSCTGRTIRTESITVRDGWSFGDRVVPNAGRVVVSFEHTADGAVVEVEISCVGGKPAKTAQRSSPGTGAKGGRDASGGAGSSSASVPASADTTTPGGRAPGRAPRDD